MDFNVFHLLLSSLLICLLLQKPAYAIKKSYIVYLGAHSHGPSPSDFEAESATNSHYELLGSHVGSLEKAKESIFYSYNRHINGFAAMLEEEEAKDIAKNPKVVSVFLNKMMKLHTTRTWQFLGLEKDRIVPKDSIWEKARYGEDIIIGNLDTGVWPESKSFDDKGFGRIPSKWRGDGACQLDRLNGSNRFPCNKKLIGARSFYKGYEAALGESLNASLTTARDNEGHGTHTLSTAGGNFVPGVTVFGNGNGTAKGGSPKARVAAYKVCWPSVNGVGGCLDADVLAGFEAAISDHVDVLSVSAGSTSPQYLFIDSFAIGSFHAVAKGIVVINSAGNEGPGPGTVSSAAPWMIAVAASSIDRSFTSYVELGNKKQLKGSSLSVRSFPSHKLYPLIDAKDAKLAKANASDAKTCADGTLDPKKVKGKILVCLVEEGKTGASEQYLQGFLAGAVGVVSANDEHSGNKIYALPSPLPSSNLNFTNGEYVYSYLQRTKNPMAYLTKPKTEVNVKPSPMMAEFSSRGPNIVLPSILKPDVTAPGLDIIAAYSEVQGSVYAYIADSGTSMSCPHVAGIVGLLKALHPHWSPAAIQSAIMTTATTVDDGGRPILDSFYKKATPFNYGSGHIQPNFAMDPGLVYDLNTVDYLNVLCASGYSEAELITFYDRPYSCPKSYNLADFNYPSITVLDLKKTPVTVTRTVTNVGSPSTYKVYVKNPKGVSVSVKPSSLTFTKVGEKKTFKIILQTMGVAKPGSFVFGELCWSDGKHKVRSPLVVKHK
ncbi:hypothetical protein L6164_001251 [Bauhinia variegata]|uniref:Uncharacterized protein n=1 Tax=Bauhinia variegata TaxID=167791 RepID=A0ACB9Q938_BAUVA|nr:hypothetical protein L6164_001251 [Bauhinia variegata]